MNTYPEMAGFKERGGTSEMAAAEINRSAETIRNEIANLFEKTHFLTPESAAFILKLSILSVRPRFTELKLSGIIRKTRNTVKNSNNKSVRVWERVSKQYEQVALL